MTIKKNVKNILRKNKPETIKKINLKEKIRHLDFKDIGIVAVFLVVFLFLIYLMFFRGWVNKEDISSVLQSGVEELKQGKIDEAGDKFEKIIKRDGDNLEAKYNLAIVKYNKKEYEEAIYDLNIVVKMNPEDKKSYNVLGNIYRDLKKYEEAIDSYTRAIKNDPKFASPYINLTMLLIDVNRKNEAVKIISNGLLNIPNNSNLKKLEKYLSAETKS